MKRPHGIGTLYIKWGSYYGRWLAPDGRQVSCKLGKVRARGARGGGLTRREAEHGLRRLIEVESRRPPPSPEERPRSVDEAARRRAGTDRARGCAALIPQNCESMQRIHISPGMGSRRIDAVTQDEVERLASATLRKGLAPKTVRNVMTFLYPCSPRPCRW
jgi:hypothetical protein